MSAELVAILDISAVIVAIAIIILSWFYLPHEVFMWGIRFALLLLVIVGLVNGWVLIRDFVA